MIGTSDFIHLSYTRDLTEGGIAYALHDLPHGYGYQRVSNSPYDRLRRTVANAAVELAFRRHLSERNVPFEVKSAAPFTEPNRYDVILGGRRCDLKSFLMSHQDQISRIQHDPQVLLKAPALVASDQHAGGHSQHDLYLFGFLLGQTAASHRELQKAVQAGQSYYLVHVMPGGWNRTSKWNPLGTLVVKSEAEESLIIEISGQDEGRETQSCTVELPPRQRVEIPSRLFSLAYIHVKSSPSARIGIHSPARNETYLINPLDWSNIWVYGTDVWLAGYASHEEFSRRAEFVQAGSRVFQYDRTQVKNLAVPVSELRPLAELFERVKTWSSQTAT